MSFLNILIFFILRVSLLQSLQIFNRDPIFDYSNSGYLSYFGLPFKLSTNLASNEYISLTVSFNLHSEIENTPHSYALINYFTPSNLIMSLSAFSNDCTLPTSQTSTNIYTKSVDSTQYFVQFKDSKGNYMGLNKNTWYILWVNMTDSNVLNLQTSNKLLQIQMSSVSTPSDNYITYDRNPVISVFQLLDTPDNTLDTSVKFANPDQQYVLSANNLVYIDITTHNIVKNNAKLKYFLSDNSFRFNGVCSSIAKTDNPTIQAFPSNNYTCSINTLENSVTVVFSNVINSAFSIRIQVYIMNPSRVIQSGYIKTLLLYAENNIIAETGSSSVVLKTVNLPLSLNKLNLAWNINPSNSSSFQFAMKIVRCDAASPAYYPYNSFILNFMVGNSTPSNVKLRVNINLFTETGATFLIGSISETLPSYDSNTKVSCKLTSNSDTSRKIQCTGVGRLMASTIYKIGFKMAFPYDFYTPDIIIQNKFGVIYIETFNPFLNDYDANYLIPQTTPQNLQAISTINNKNWLPTDSNYKKTTISTQLSSEAIEDPKVSGNLGIQINANSQRLIFSLHTPYSDISTSSSSANTAIANSAGLFIMSNSIFPQTTGTTAAFEDSAGTTHASISVTISAESSEDINFGLITFSASNSDGLLKAFASAATDKIFAFSPFNITQSYSIYADTANYDFYLVGADSIAGTYNQRTINSYVLINAQGYYGSSFSQMKFAVSNFWTGDSTTIGSLTGTDFPALIYISGKLSTEEATGVTKLAVFLQNVEPFYALENYNNEYYVSCNTSEAKNCSGVINNSPDYINYFTMNRVEISVTDPSQQFSVIIPVKTKPNQGEIYLYFASLGTFSYYATNKPYYQILTASKLYSWSFTPKSSSITYPYLIAGITSPLYGIKADCLTCYPGSIVDIDMKIGHTDSGVLTANDASNFGAGFTYISTSDILTISTQFTSTYSTSDNPCLTFSYFYDENLSLEKYGFFCPLFQGSVNSASIINLEQIKLPITEGGYLNGIGIFSLKDGNLASAALDQGLMSYKGSITKHAITPAVFNKGFKQVRIYWTFQTTNPISDSNCIKIVLSQNANFKNSDTSYCILAYSNGNNINHTCEILVESQKTFSYIIKTNQTIAAGLFNLYHYGIDSDDSDGQDTDFNVYLYAIFSQNSNYIIDQTSTTASFKYLNTVSVFPSISLSMSFNNYNCKSKTYFDIGFQINLRGLYATESFVLDLTPIANDNSDNLDYECLVLNLNKEKTNDFLSIEFSSGIPFTEIKLTPKQDITSFSQPYYLRCYHIKAPEIFDSNGGFNFTAFVSSQDNSIIISKTSGRAQIFNYTTVLEYFQLSFNQKLLSSPGNAQDISIYLSSFSNLTYSSRIIIWFPYYYPANLNQEGKVYCYINNTQVYCEIDQIRRLVVKYLPMDILANTLIALRIIGPKQGIVRFYSYFYVALDQDYDETNYLEIGSVKDIEFTTLSQFILDSTFIYSFSLSSTFIREDTDYSMEFFLSSSIEGDLLATNTFLYLEFPSLFSVLFAITPPSCSLVNQNEKINNNYVEKCDILGSNIKITINQDLPKGYYYLLKIQGVQAPSWEICLNDKIVLNIVSGDQSNLVARSFFNTINFGNFHYSQNSQKTLLFFQDATNGAEITSYKINPGVYSDVINILESSNEAFNKNFIVYSNQAAFEINPKQITGKIGNIKENFQFTCPQNTAYGIYYLALNKMGDGGYYTALPVLPINVTSSPVQLNLYQSSYNVQIGSKKFVIYEQLPLQYPNDYITLIFSLSEPSYGLTLNENMITLNKNNQYGFISLSSMYNESFISQSVILNLNISGPNSNSYVLSSSSLSLNLIANYTADITISLESNNNPTNVLSTTASISCSSAGLGYYQITQANCSFIGKENIISYVKSYYVYNENDICENQFGIIYFETDSQTKQIQINNIKSNKKYTIYGFCQDFNENTTIVSKSNFQGKDNGGILLKITFSFESELSGINKERVACFLNSYLGIPTTKVISEDFVYCQTLTATTSRFLQSTSNLTINSSSLNNSNETSNNTSINYYQLDYYFLPVDDLESDNSWQTIFDICNNSETFMGYLNGNATGLPKLINMSTASEVSYVNEPEFSSSTNLNLTANEKLFFFQGLSLKNNGYLYMEIYEGNISNDTTPSYEQIINNKKWDDSSALELKIVKIISNDYPLLNFSGLAPNTSYIVAYFGTNDNPSSQESLKTEIRKFNVTTLEAVVTTTFSRNLVVGWMILFWIMLEILGI